MFKRWKQRIIKKHNDTIISMVRDHRKIETNSIKRDALYDVLCLLGAEEDK